MNLEQIAFQELIFEKFPKINKNLIKDYIKVNKLFTMKDFLNKYDVLNQETINKLHDDIFVYMFS